MPPIFFVALTLLFVSLAAAHFRKILRKKVCLAGQTLPPGPRPLPFLGNIFDIKTHAPWISYTEWGALYGDLVYSRVLGQEIIIINSEKVARDLLEKRTYKYSDRPAISTIIPFGLSSNIIFLRYGYLWRLHRRLFHQSFRFFASLHFRPMQLRKARQLLLNLLITPESYDDHFQMYAAAIIMSAVYGHEVKSRDDPLVTMARQATDLAAEATTPRKVAMLRTFPFLLRLPSWFLGVSLKNDALHCRRSVAHMVATLYRTVQLKLRHSRTVTPCMVSDSLRRFKDRDAIFSMDGAVMDAAATAFGAGSETTSSTLLVFLFAMVLHPRVQEQAQREIDSIVGTNRLPDFSDRPSLPYVDAIIRETLRWHPVMPLGIPHAVTNSDIYEGYYIPEGATVIANAWAMSRNEQKYPDPSEFKPERFLTAEGKLNDDSVGFAFGFGRRICVGRYMADASLWSAIVSLLAVFRFMKAQDAQGKDVNIELQWTSGTTSHPLSFPCRIVPRSTGMTSEKLAQLNRQSTLHRGGWYKEDPLVGFESPF